LDKKIVELKTMKRGYEARAIDHENQGQRLQFINSELERAKKHWAIAEKNRLISMEIQKDIKSFEVKKGMLLEGNEIDVFESQAS